ncbi:MAG: hypothetical protein ACOCV9_02655, partial [Marinilabiliaceae bacterium]
MDKISSESEWFSEWFIRHLEPTEKGIPVQIYAFSWHKEWARFEGVQADIFDHILSVVELFELRVFQVPGGDDIRDLAGLKSD